MIPASLPAAQQAYAENYSIWVCDVEITDVNADQVTGTGIGGFVSYNQEENTLILSSAAIDSTTMDLEAAIYTTRSELNVSLNGANTIKSGSTAFLADNSGKLLFTEGSGSLTLEAENTGIHAGTVQISDDCTIDSKGTTTSAISGTVINEGLGLGWDNAAGSGAGTGIGKSTNGQELLYKRVRFAPDLGVYDIRVGGTMVTDNNADDIPAAAPAAKTGTASFDPATNTLTLEDYKTGNEQGPAILIGSGNSAPVNLVFKGNNILKGSTSATGAGIQVEAGAKIVIDGEDGAVLNVTGGKWGAGIGGAGQGAPGKDYPKMGEIVIEGGTIIATGGEKSAGIGSGFHASSSSITINGGDVTALGSDSGAGIGTGYGSSGGGDPESARIGYYHAGTITINGGIVKAAGWHADFDSFDPYDPEALLDANYSNWFAAGIGGGYGASSGSITIGGDSSVIALGSSGGAGIGTGRGTANVSNFDQESADCQITVQGNADVIAIAAPDTRQGMLPTSGAGIGLGRGWNHAGFKKGTIKILENAKVYAYAGAGANGIGASSHANKTHGPAHLGIIEIADNCTVAAVSGKPEESPREAIDEDPGSKFYSQFSGLNTAAGFYQEWEDYFAKEPFPYKVTAVDADDSNLGEVLFVLASPDAQSAAVFIPNTTSVYQYKLNDQVYISNADEENSSRFTTDVLVRPRYYDAAGLTIKLDQSAVMDSKQGKLKTEIRAREGIFEYGSTFGAEAIEDAASVNELNSRLDGAYSDKVGKILYFGASVRNREGNPYTLLKGGKATLQLQLPEGWNPDRTLIVFIQSGEDISFADTQSIFEKDGVSYVEFETDRLGTFALIETTGAGVEIRPGAHMTKTAASGALVQDVTPGTEMTPVVFTADEGYYFPEDYPLLDINGVQLTRDSASQLTVSGKPFASVYLELIDASETSPVHVHILRRVDAKAADCTESGNILYYVCEECGKYFEDATAVSEITDKESVILPATGHVWDNGVITRQPTYSKAGERTYTCLNDSSHTRTEVIPKKEKHYDESDSTKDLGAAAVGAWTRDAAGWHYLENGVPVRNAWREITYNGITDWYYFGETGTMATGWLEWNGSIYYLWPVSDGQMGYMVTGWVTIDGTEYYFEPEAGKNKGHLRTDVPARQV